MKLQCEWALRHLGLALSPLELWAFGFLEMRGLRFLVHFGTANAIEQAEALLWSDHFKVH